VKKPNLHSCNVLELRPESRQLWRFSTEGKIRLQSEQSLAVSEILPAKWVAKSWRALFQKKLNIAWLPAGQVFLRVLHLPLCEPEELPGMVEFQLEKVSPLPVGQILWSFEVIPGKLENQQAVVVIVAARNEVETILGQLETTGYLPDRLELPQLHQLLKMPVEEDGAWIYFDSDQGASFCVAAWWFHGTLQMIHLLHLPETEDRAALLAEELNNMAWAGEIEGWLQPPAKVHLVADESIAGVWESALSQWAGDPVKIIAPLPKPVLAEVAAQRAARGESRANLLPSDYLSRYQQQFVDRLWMRGLGAVLLVYIVGVAAYFGVLQVLGYQQTRAEQQVRSLSTPFTNALQLNEQVGILQDQLELKYAALDSWKAASELLPLDLTLLHLRLQNGRALIIQGTALPENTSLIYDYNEAMRKATIDGEPVFSSVTSPRILPRAGMSSWDFTADLKRTAME
jgi:hypothetical protein